MLNDTQTALLYSFIASDGIYFEAVKDYSGIDLGTKVLYLERAISQDRLTFLESLDKLYQPEFEEEAKAANLYLIRSLMFINAFFINSDVKFEISGIQSTFRHFFGSLDEYTTDLAGQLKEGSALSDMRDKTERALHEGIRTLSEKFTETVEMQKKARLEAEKHISGHLGWRREYELPDDLRVGSTPNIVSSYVDRPSVTRSALLHSFRERLRRSEPLLHLVDEISSPLDTRATIFESASRPSVLQNLSFFEATSSPVRTDLSRSFPKPVLSDLKHEYTRLPLWVEELIRYAAHSPAVRLMGLDAKIANSPRNSRVKIERTRLLSSNCAYSKLLEGKALQQEFARLPKESLQKLVRLNDKLNSFPDDLEERLSRAHLLSSNKYYEYALPDLNYLIDREPNNINARLERASLCENDPYLDGDGALEDYQAVLEIDPDNTVAIERILRQSQSHGPG